jgi:glyceraldehyde-3-phosphate dehydrogenase (NADP+)
VVSLASAIGLFSRIDALRCFSIRSMVAAPEDDTNRDLLRDILLGRTSNFINTDYLF